MRAVLFFVTIVLFAFQSALATAESSSVVSLLDGAKGKFVWQRWAWCNEDYSPKSESQATADGKTLMLLDTDEGSERALLSGLGSFHGMRISRSGRWVTFIEGTKTYIVDMTSGSPAKNVFLDKNDCTFWAVRAMWVNPDNGDEYAYCLDNAAYPDGSNGDGIYKVKINADGTADQAHAEEIVFNSTENVDESFSVSADGAKLGGAFPWPDTYIIDIASGELDMRHEYGFGCQANLAPDNSYRFFHCEGDHLGVWMWAPDMVDEHWLIDLSINLDGIPSASTVMDFAAPRWSNHVRFYTATYPMGDNHDCYCGMQCYMEDNGSLWSKSADWVQNQINMEMVPQFFIGKFASDFRSQESSLLIASDQRYFQYGGDAWISSGVVDGNVGISDKKDEIPLGRSIQRAGESVIINAGFAARAAVRIADAQGRIVRSWSGTGTYALDMREFAAGAYMLTVTTGNRTESVRLPVTGKLQ